MLSHVKTIEAGVGVGVGVAVGVGTGVGVGVDIGVGEGSGVAIGVGVGVATGSGFLIATPLFQTSFVPDLTQVNFLPKVVAVDPAFEHLAPALGEAACTGTDIQSIRRTTRAIFPRDAVFTSESP